MKPSKQPKKKSGTAAAPRSRPAKKAPAASPSRPSQALVARLCQALDEKKAEDLRVLDVGEQSSITDYLVLATGNSETHLRALRIEVDRVLKESGTRVIGQDSVRESGWTVVDAFDVMVHLFLPEKRDFFGLENLWKDAADVPLAKLIGPAAAKLSSARPTPASRQKKS